jgi:hypothetical protein
MMKAGAPLITDAPKARKFKRFGGSRPDLQKVGKPKTDHGKMKLFNEGGVMKDDIKKDKSMVKKAVGMHEKQLHGGKKSDMSKLKKGGMTKMARGGGVEAKGKTKGTMVKMKSGGKAC